jgi:hypothetical protein
MIRLLSCVCVCIRNLEPYTILYIRDVCRSVSTRVLSCCCCFCCYWVLVLIGEDRVGGTCSIPFDEPRNTREPEWRGTSKSGSKGETTDKKKRCWDASLPSSLTDGSLDSSLSLSLAHLYRPSQLLPAETPVTAHTHTQQDTEQEWARRETGSIFDGWACWKTCLSFQGSAGNVREKIVRGL